MELEVGQFVRTKKGIAKIKTLDDLDNVAWTDNKEIYFGINRPSGKLYFEPYDDGIVLKASHNIIELLEEKDLLEIEYFSLRYEKRVTRLFEVTFKDERYINLDNSKCQFMLIDNDWSNSDKELEPIIKSIVTKEQFSQISYNLPKNK